MDLDHFYKIHMPWLAVQILEHSRMSEIRTPEGEPWDFRLWMVWAARAGFVFTWPDPPTLGFIARPVSLAQVEGWQEIPLGELLYVFDTLGEVLWFDFLWAPGQYNVVLEFAKMTGKTWVGWQHKKTFKPHLKLIAKMKMRQGG